jgi:hypothetical protein
LFLSWVFKFHGVDPEQYQAHTVASWLGGGATVQAEVHTEYLKLDIGKPLYKLEDITVRSKNVSSVGSEWSANYASCEEKIA